MSTYIGSSGMFEGVHFGCSCGGTSNRSKNHKERLVLTRNIWVVFVN